MVLATVGGYLWLATSWFQDVEVEPSPCPVCEETVPFRTRKQRAHAECSNCGAYERHRLLGHFLSHTPGLLNDGDRVLHFAPNDGLKAAFRRRTELHYVTADLWDPEDLKLDITEIDQPDASWDLVLCYHVLEHVPDDAAAMRELYRVLAPGGKAVLQVPLEPGRRSTYEDPDIIDPQARLEHFGQTDHVRIYGTDDFPRRLEAAGFVVEGVDYLGALPPEVVQRHHLRQQPDDGPGLDERIWVATKPPG